MRLLLFFQYCLFAGIATLCSTTNACAQDDLDLHARLGKVDTPGIFLDPAYYSWCSTVIKGEDGRYHMFYSRWPHGSRANDDDTMNHIFDGFRGWNKYSEIAYAVADHIQGPYRYVATILKGDGDKSRWDRFTMHNPQVRKFGDHYYLYYISNSYDSSLFRDNTSFSVEWKHWLQYNATQKIGVLKFRNFKELLAGNATRSVTPLMQPDGVNTFEVTTNPSVTQGPDGKYYMMFKSRKPNVGNMTFWMAVSDRPDGAFSLLSEVFTSADMACEDPCVWYDHQRKRFYAVAKYYSNSKKLAPQFGALILISSADGRKWSAADHSLVSMRELHFANGSTLQLAHLERPFAVTDENGQVIALFAAASVKEPARTGTNIPFDQNSFIVYLPLR